MSNKPNRFSNLALFAHIGTFPTRNLNKNLFRTSDVSTHSRYIPDTYPTHTRYICIPHEYPTNIPRMPHEYPTQRITMRAKELPTYFFSRCLFSSQCFPAEYPLCPYWLFCARRWSAVSSSPLHSTPYALHSTLYTLHSTPSTLHLKFT